MASPAAIERRRREMAATYAKAARLHQPRATLRYALVRLTCDLLRAEMRAVRRAERAAGRQIPETDLFGPKS